MEAMTIGDFGKVAGVAPKTIRFYEDKGLLPRPVRSSSGYRVYGERDVRRVLLIRRARALGFSLSEVGRLVRLAEHESCASFEGALARDTARKLEEVDHLMLELADRREQLVALSEHLATEVCSDCQTPALECCDSLGGQVGA